MFGQTILNRVQATIHACKSKCTYGAQGSIWMPTAALSLSFSSSSSSKLQMSPPSRLDRTKRTHTHTTHERCGSGSVISSLLSLALVFSSSSSSSCPSPLEFFFLFCSSTTRNLYLYTHTHTTDLMAYTHIKVFIVEHRTSEEMIDALSRSKCLPKNRKERNNRGTKRKKAGHKQPRVCTRK